MMRVSGDEDFGASVQFAHRMLWADESGPVAQPVDVAAGPEPMVTEAANDPFAGLPAPTVIVPAAEPPAPAASVAAVPAPQEHYVGETPVDRQWLAERETALVAVRSDYEVARAQAQAQVGSGPGWTAATLGTDESGRVFSLTNAPIAFIEDAAPSVVGYDESGAPVLQQVGHWVEFDEAAFAASYRAQAGAPLQALAAVYQTDVASLFANHPELWRIATSDHALNAGPALAGQAMGDAGQLGMLDLYLADPQISALIDAYGSAPPPAASAIAQEQVRVYGAERYEQLGRFASAMQSVRDQYQSALNQASTAGSGPGWIDRDRSVTVSDESGQTSTQTLYVTDESGGPVLDAAGQRIAVTEHVFDPDQFTAWYLQQGGLQHQAFASFYGASHTQFATDESGRTFASTVSFDNPNWSTSVGGAMTHRELVSIDPNHPPDLVNDEAVGYDLEAGWATSVNNIEQDEDWFETAIQIVIIAAVAYVSAGTLGPAVAGAVGATGAAAAAVSAAVVGAATSIASGAMNGNLTLKGILTGALSGALTGGLMAHFTPAVLAATGTTVTTAAGTTVTVATTATDIANIALRTTVQGGVQALLGGQFKDGALTGFASGLAQVVTTGMHDGIAKALDNKTLDPALAGSATMFTRVVGSAIRALANPIDPSYAFASEFMGEVLNQIGAPAQAAQTTPIAFDDDGNLMPGIVDPAASPEVQRSQLQDQLMRQGFGADEASRVIDDYAAAQAAPPAVPLPDPFAELRDDSQLTYREALADYLGIDPSELQDVGLLDDAGRSFDVLRGYAEGCGFSILDTGSAVIDIAKNPVAFINGVKALISSPAARAALGEAVVRQFQVNVMMLEDAWNSGDMRGTGQALGKLTTDVAQLAGGVGAIAKLGVTTATAGGRLLLGAADDLAAASALRGLGLFAADGKPLMDFRALSTVQKQVIGETMGADVVRRLVPDAQRIGRTPLVGETGIDDLYRVARPDVDFVVVEYKFGSSTLGSTLDGLQMSDNWLLGAATGKERILQALNGNRVATDAVMDAMAANRIEKWIVHTDPLGNVTVGLLDASGKVIKQPVSRLFGGQP